MINPQTLLEKAAAAFWHKSRRQFIPCTASDVSARSGINKTRSVEILARMSRSNLAIATNHGNYQTYDLTPKGKALVTPCT